MRASSEHRASTAAQRSRKHSGREGRAKSRAQRAREHSEHPTLTRFPSARLSADREQIGMRAYARATRERFQVCYQYLCFSSVLSPLCIHWRLLVCASRWPQNANRKNDAVSSLLSTSLLLLPPHSSLYILVAPVLLQQVVPH